MSTVTITLGGRDFTVEPLKLGALPADPVKTTE